MYEINDLLTRMIYQIKNIMNVKLYLVDNGENIYCNSFNRKF